MGMPTLRCISAVAVTGLCVPIVSCAAGQEGVGDWRGQHIFLNSSAGVATAERLVTEHLAPLGVNVLVVEVNYNFAYQSHPELSSGDITAEDAHRLARTCRESGVRLIPLFNCLGHQSWARTTFPLLTQYPEFDETPRIPLDNPGIYCRSWCPSHPDVNRVVFDLLDELIEAFEADAIHVGMDEVFLIADDGCERCRGKDPAELFAKAVNDIHAHLVDEKGVEMLLWGDRLLDAEETGYSEWEASTNGTAPARAMIPNDIIVCDWHYGLREDYPSLRLFQTEGFRVLPCPWDNADAARALLDSALADPSPRMLGALCTGWSAGDGGEGILKVLSGEVGPEAYTEAAVLLHAVERLSPATE